MLSAGSDPGQPMKSRGFTLLELMVVLGIVALLLAVTPPLLSGMLPGVEIRGAAREMVSALRYTRGRAIATRRDTLMVLDLEEKHYSVSGRGKTYTLPAKADLQLVTADSELMDDRRGAIRFFPDGSSTGGRITLASGENRYQIDVDWFTGRVKILD